MQLDEDVAYSISTADLVCESFTTAAWIRISFGRFTLSSPFVCQTNSSVDTRSFFLALPMVLPKLLCACLYLFAQVAFHSTRKEFGVVLCFFFFAP